MKEFECFTVEILNDESSVIYGAFINYEQAEKCFEENKYKVGDSFHFESYGIAIIGWNNGKPCTIKEWELSN